MFFHYLNRTYKMDTIIKALVEAGYFRARISTLSDFDKIIGGIAWAMQVFSYDINVNIFYTDTLDLGQKIALTEKFVMVLLVMNCPYQIEPHQIVGLDYVNLLPVVSWLIKRSADVRNEHEAFNRLMALRHFHRVTNTVPDSFESRHLLPMSHIKELRNSRDDQSKIDDTKPKPMAPDAISILMDRISRDFKLNQHVSLIGMPSLSRIANRGQESAGGHERNELSEASSDTENEEMDDKSNPAKYSSIDESSPLDQRSLEETALASVEHQSEEFVSLHKELDTELLATNQKIVNLLKKLDCMPSQLEIIQYQKRYVELHQQLISKNKDIKKLYALLNSLDSTKHYLTKEINLLDSILANFDLTNDSAVNRDEFLRQFRDIIAKVQSVRDDVISRLTIMKQKSDAINAEYADLLN